MIRWACGWISPAIKKGTHQHSLPVRQEAEAGSARAVGPHFLAVVSGERWGPCPTHSKGKINVFGDKKEQRRQEAFNSPSRHCAVTRQGWEMSLPHTACLSPRTGWGAEQWGCSSRCRGSATGSSAGEAPACLGWAAEWRAGGQAAREREEPWHFSSRSAPPPAGPWLLGEYLSYFHFYDVGFPDFLGWSNVHEHVTCSVSLCNLVLRRPKNIHVFCPHLAPGMSLLVWHTQIYISDLC